MTYRYETLPLKDIKEELYPKLKNLTLPTGCMWPKFLARKRSRISFATLVWNNDKLIAWGISYRWRTKEDSEIMLFVRRNHRREGIGANLVKELKNVTSKVRCFPWDDRSRGFFNAIELNDVAKWWRFA